VLRLCSTHLLAHDPGERIALRQYEVSRLMMPFAFDTDPEDGIEDVSVMLLRLKPLDTEGERVTLECLRDARSTIWEAARERFGITNPLDGGWRATQVRLRIGFRPKTNSRRRTLPVTITMPHGCDLKDRTEHERLIGGKYLRRWGILVDAG
jgi:hypothetical protein